MKLPGEGPDRHGTGNGVPAADGDGTGGDFSAWLDMAPGCSLLDWAGPQMAQAVDNVFGYYAVQLGLPALDALAASRIPHCIRVQAGLQPSPAGGWQPAVRVAHFGELPFETHSVDLVVLPLQLECSPDPHQLLREVDRILRPEGRLVTLGINPWSLWGLRQGLPARMGGAFLPGVRALISAPRLRDWIRLLSFEPGETAYGCHAWPADGRGWLQRPQRLVARAGERWWPVCGAGYVLSAVKRVHGMRLIGPAWRGMPARGRVVVSAGSQRNGPDGHG